MKRLPFHGLSTEQWGNLATAASLLVYVLYGGWIVCDGLVQGWGVDYLHFWSGAKVILNGGNPYLGLYPHPLLPAGECFHPPLWVALLFVPLALLPFEVGIRVWFGLNTAMLGSALWVLAWRLWPPRSGWQRYLILVYAMWLGVPVLATAQLAAAMLLALCLAVWAIRTGRFFVSGLLLTLLLLKPWVVIFVIPAIFVASLRMKRPSIVVGFLIGAALLIGLSAIVLPGWWWDLARSDLSRATQHIEGGMLISYPPTTLLTWLESVWHVPARVAQVAYICLLGSLSVLAGGLFWCYWRQRLGLSALLAGTIAFSLLGTPYVREHDYVLWCLPLFVSWAIRWTLPVRWVGWALAAVMGMTVLLRALGGLLPWSYNTTLLLGTANAYLLAAQLAGTFSRNTEKPCEWMA